MTWQANAPYKAESKKICWEVAPYLRGRGVDIGAGSFKVLPHVISVDNEIDKQLFGLQMYTDVKVKSADDLAIFGSESMDFVYSSHLLEHMEDPGKALKEWWRLAKMGGYMVLYLPHEDLYPKVGEPGANHDHKHNLNEEKVMQWMEEVTDGWDVVECQKRDQDDEYSFLMVFKKLRPHIWEFSYRKPKPVKTALVCRFGAFGDLMQASSVLAGLKQGGYHVTLMCSLPAASVVEHDPHVDTFMYLGKDQVPNPDLAHFWNWQAKKYDKFVNLSESVEGTWLALPGRASHSWPPALRDKLMSANYLEFQHDLAGVPNKQQVKFYATTGEKKWAKEQRAMMGAGSVVMWSLAGSAVHKTWAGMDNIIAGIMLHFPNSHVVLVGGPECEILEAGWENEPRVHKTSGKWSIRQSLAFLSECDMVIGSETGILNAACNMDLKKVCFLSHSSWQNLTKDWKNTTAIWSENTKCKGRGDNEAAACHMLHYGWDHCTQDEKSGVAQCQADITVEEVWAVVETSLREITEKVA